MPHIPSDPFDPQRSTANEHDPDREARLEREAQFNREFAEEPAGTGKHVLLALIVALLLGAAFYGLNNSSVHQASTNPPAQTAKTQPANPNSQPGMTTGSAINHPTPPQSSSTGTAGENNDNR
jgi:hypothetical protein